MVGNVGFDRVGMVGIEENVGWVLATKTKVVVLTLATKAKVDMLAFTVSAMKAEVAKVAMLAFATVAMKAKVAMLA